MNYPMLYWFVPRELVSFVKILLVGLLLLGGYLVVRYVRNSAPPGPARTRRILWLAAVALPLCGLLAGNEIMERRQLEQQTAERRQYVQQAWAHFKSRCETAHISYYKTVPPQAGVFIMKPAAAPTIAQLKDQFWMGDPYDLPDTPENEARGLLYRQKSLPVGSVDAENNRGGFDYVEAPHPDQPGKFLRFTLRPGKKNDYRGYNLHTTGSETVDKRQSRYGYTWDDISTPEDRKYWVAGGRLRVVELDSGTVVAERVGYKIEKYFGATSSTFNQEPWRGARGCPIRITAYSGIREFISAALGTWSELEQNGEPE